LGVDPLRGAPLAVPAVCARQHRAASSDRRRGLAPAAVGFDRRAGGQHRLAVHRVCCLRRRRVSSACGTARAPGCLDLAEVPTAAAAASAASSTAESRWGPGRAPEPGPRAGAAQWDSGGLPRRGKHGYRRLCPVGQSDNDGHLLYRRGLSFGGSAQQSEQCGNRIHPPRWVNCRGAPLHLPARYRAERGIGSSR
jgi:hypothetical protein